MSFVFYHKLHFLYFPAYLICFLNFKHLLHPFTKSLNYLLFRLLIHFFQFISYFIRLLAITQHFARHSNHQSFISYYSTLSSPQNTSFFSFIPQSNGLHIDHSFWILHHYQYIMLLMLGDFNFLFHSNQLMLHLTI